MVRSIAVVASAVIATASLRMGLGLPPFGVWLHVPAWANFAGAAFWALAAILAAACEEPHR